MRYIYLIRKDNEPIYIGQSNDPKRRFKDHKQKKFKNVSGLTYEILGVSDDRTAAYFMETEYQKKYNLLTNDKIAKENGGKIGGKIVGNNNKINGTLQKATIEAAKKKSIGIICFNDDEYYEFNSIRDCFRSMNICRKAISSVLDKNIKHKNYYFNKKLVT